MTGKFARYEIDLNAKCVCGCMEGDRVHKIYRFPNDYGASVVSGRKENGRVGQYRMFVLHFESPAPEHCWEVTSDNPVSAGNGHVGVRGLGPGRGGLAAHIFTAGLSNLFIRST